MTDRAGWRALVGVAVVAFAMIGILLLMQRPVLCPCGWVSLWEGQVHSAANSQQVADWYSPSHFIHGLLFYALGWLLLRRWSWASRLTLAALLEAAWEIAENSPVIIDRYRAATMAFGYSGDSILNSTSDLVMMLLGFLFATRAPLWVSVALLLVLELLTLWLIRDNLTLNIIMLVWPIEALKAWQGG